MRTFDTIHQVVQAANTDIGQSDWMVVDQARIDAFAEVTEDRQWIHVDVEQSKDGPFGGTIAHGYLTLSLLPKLGAEVFTFATPGPRINYGLNKVRFPSPVPAGSRIRVQVAFADVEQLANGHRVGVRYEVQIDGHERPACVAEGLVLLLP